MEKIRKLKKKLRDLIRKNATQLERLAESRKELSEKNTHLENLMVETRRLLNDLRQVQREQSLEASNKVREISKREDRLMRGERQFAEIENRFM